VSSTHLERARITRLVIISARVGYYSARIYFFTLAALFITCSVDSSEPSTRNSIYLKLTRHVPDIRTVRGSIIPGIPAARVHKQSPASTMAFVTSSRAKAPLLGAPT